MDDDFYKDRIAELANSRVKLKSEGYSESPAPRRQMTPEDVELPDLDFTKKTCRTARIQFRTTEAREKIVRTYAALSGVPISTAMEHIIDEFLQTDRFNDAINRGK